MKKFTLIMLSLITFVTNSQAMRYSQAKEEALFLTDKMAYELNLNEQQYEAAYEINLDYLMGVNTADDLYTDIWIHRNADLRYVLLDWQYSAFCAASYFYRPIYWSAGVWHFGIYAHYPHRDFMYFGRPACYVSYAGGHSWRHNGGHSWYGVRVEYYHGRSTHIGMRENYHNGRYNNGGHSVRYSNGNGRANGNSYRRTETASRGNMSQGQGRVDTKNFETNFRRSGEMKNPSRPSSTRITVDQQNSERSASSSGNSRSEARSSSSNFRSNFRSSAGSGTSGSMSSSEGMRGSSRPSMSSNGSGTSMRNNSSSGRSAGNAFSNSYRSSIGGGVSSGGASMSRGGRSVSAPSGGGNHGGRGGNFGGGRR